MRDNINGSVEAAAALAFGPPAGSAAPAAVAVDRCWRTEDVVGGGANVDANITGEVPLFATMAIAARMAIVRVMLEDALPMLLPPMVLLLLGRVPFVDPAAAFAKTTVIMCVFRRDLLLSPCFSNLDFV